MSIRDRASCAPASLDCIINLFPPVWQLPIRGLLSTVIPGCQEIRLRVGQYPLFISAEKTYRWEQQRLTQEDLLLLMEAACQGSLYAYEEELRMGYLTISGGHRIGFSGKAVLNDGGIQRIKNFNALNIRIASQRIGVASRVMPYIIDWKHGHPHHTLILSPPRAGKTTLLRDIARCLSTGSHVGVKPFQVAVIDERSELAGCYQGIPQLDLGPNTDVLDGCPKAIGIMMAIRSMAPEVIITDEIGSPQDVTALQEALNAGVSVIASAHGGGLGDVLQRPVLRDLVNAGIFSRYLVLSTRHGPGTIEFIYDGNHRVVKRGDGQ